LIYDPASLIPHPLSRIPHPTSRIPHPASRIPHPASRIPVIQNLRDQLHQGIADAFPDVRLNGHPEQRLPNTLSLGFRGKDASVLLNEWKGLAVSAGAACHAGLETISAVLLAMNVPREYALGTIRFSVGRMSTGEEISTALEIITGRRTGERSIHYIEQKAEAGPLSTTGSKAGSEHGTSSAVNKNAIKLTEYTHSLGCACKIRPQALEEIIKSIPLPSGKKVLVGTETSDDAAVYLFSKDKAIVQTVDFIPPVVDDPYSYGAIAAANALSDIWAMGAKPLFALSILAFPEKLIPFEVLQQIIRGASDKVSEAGISIIGGHSIEDDEPKFGLVVCGEVHPARIWKNSTAMAGDLLILTKPLGTGIISTAVKRGYATEAATAEAVSVMSALNKGSAEALKKYDVHACTDITGFGLLGHLKEMLYGGNLNAEIYWKQVPLLSEAWDYAVAGMIPGGSRNNLEFVSRILDCDPDMPEMVKLLLSDAQTSGGLLVALPEQQAAKAVSAITAKGNIPVKVIGKMVPGNSRIKIK